MPARRAVSSRNLPTLVAFCVTFLLAFNPVPSAAQAGQAAKAATGAGAITPSGGSQAATAPGRKYRTNATLAFDSAPVGQAAATQTVTVPFAAADTVAAISVLTQGAPNLDYSLASGGTCSVGTVAVPGQSCTVNVAFTPVSAGQRNGAAVLYSASGAVLGTGYLSQIALGPQITYSSTNSIPVGSGWTQPNSIAVDGAGNAYVAENENNRVAFVPFSAGAYGTPVTIASGDTPNDVTVDGAGNVFYTNGTTVVELPFNGAGYGSPIEIPSQLSPDWSDPTGIAVDGSGNLFVLDANNVQVVEVPWTGAAYGPGIVVFPSSELSFPLGLAIDSSDNVYVADGNFNSIFQLPNTGSGYGSPIFVSSNFVQVSNVAVDAAGNVYAVDTGAAGIYRIPWTGSAWGAQTNLLGGGYSGSSLTLDGQGNLYVVGGFGSVTEFTAATPPTIAFPTPTNIGSLDAVDGPLTVSLFNIGNQPLAFTIPTTGSNPSYPPSFPANTADSSLCASTAALTEGASCDVSVNFLPTVAGSDTESVVLTDNALNATNATQSISFNGTGTVPLASLSATSLSYGSVVVGQASNSQTVVLTNTGTGTLSFASIGVTSADASSFVFANTCGTSLAPGYKCTIHGHFAPKAGAVATAAITIADNARNSPQVIHLSGIGVALPISLSATSLSYPTTTAGQASNSQSVTLTNTSSATVPITSIAVTGTNASSWVFANSCGSSLAAGASCIVHGHFAPTAGGAMKAAVTIAYNGLGSPQSIALSGTGVEPPVMLSATSVAFGAVAIGASSYSHTVTLTNTGTATLSIAGIAVTGVDANSFVFANTCGTSLAVGANCTIHGHFAPKAGGTLSATVTITDSAPGSPQTIALSGTGQ